jgi:asparagine synthase (glutamine-hydrolysing)
MNGFLCLYKPSGQFVTGEERARFRMLLPNGEPATLRWTNEPGFSVGVTSDVIGLAPMLSGQGSLVGVGIVRLDNREEVARLAANENPAHRRTDVDLVVGAIAARGTSCMPSVVGDFTMVVWDRSSHSLHATRDPLGTKNLFYTQRDGIVAVCSRSSPLADGDRYDMDFIASFLAGGSSAPTTTIFAGVHAVPAGTMMTCERGSLTMRRFWNPRDFEIDDRLTGEAQYEEFRRLFADAVRLRVTGGNDTWAQLSGGLDSSSIVCMAQSLAAAGEIPAGVTGTVTFADTLAATHEMQYSDAVGARYGVRNEPIVDYWPWQDDGMAPPLTDRPMPLYPFYAQMRRMNTIVRRAGGRVLLSGHGSDFYLSGNLFYVADWIAQRRVWPAWKEAMRWAVASRVSFWSLAFDNAVVPLLPSAVRRMVQRDRMIVPVWVEARFARQAVLDRRFAAFRQLDAPVGQKYAGAIAHAVDALGVGTDPDVADDAPEVRYPFLHRPLVEFALRLPPVMRTRPHARKWVLREAMRGVLPEAIRTRSGKATIGPRIAWAFERERAQLDQLLRDPVLAQLGCVDGRRMKEVLNNRQHCESSDTTMLMIALSLESWLRVRSGRWTAMQEHQRTM